MWEGVTNYLSARAVDDTLATIRRISRNPNAALIITYVDMERSTSRAHLSRGHSGCTRSQSRDGFVSAATRSAVTHPRKKPAGSSLGTYTATSKAQRCTG